MLYIFQLMKILRQFNFAIFRFTVCWWMIMKYGIVITWRIFISKFTWNIFQILWSSKGTHFGYRTSVSENNLSDMSHPDITILTRNGWIRPSYTSWLNELGQLGRSLISQLSSIKDPIIAFRPSQNLKDVQSLKHQSMHCDHPSTNCESKYCKVKLSKYLQQLKYIQHTTYLSLWRLRKCTQSMISSIWWCWSQNVHIIGNTYYFACIKHKHYFLMN